MAISAVARTLYITLHQLTVPLVAYTLYRVNADWTVTLATPFAAALAPLAHALYAVRSGGDRRWLRTALASALCGFAVALTLLAGWLLLAWFVGGGPGG